MPSSRKGFGSWKRVDLAHGILETLARVSECSFFETIPTGQGPHLTGSGHVKPILNEVKYQV